MQTQFAVDLGLPPTPTPTHFERMPLQHPLEQRLHPLEHDGVAIRGLNHPQQHHLSPPLDYLGNTDACAAIDSAVDLSVSSTFEDLLDCDLSLLEDWNPPTPSATATDHSQWPLLHPHCGTSADPAPPASSEELERILPESMPRPGGSTACKPRPSGAGMQNAHSDPSRVRNKPEGSQRAHYAVEKRYRSTLNEKYAALARALSSEPVQRICKSKSPGWAFEADHGGGGTSDANQMENERELQQPQQQQGTRSRQRKTTTLSVVIDTIHILSVCCREEAKELEQLRSGMETIRNNAARLLVGGAGVGVGPVPAPHAPSPSQQLQVGASSGPTPSPSSHQGHHVGPHR